MNNQDLLQKYLSSANALTEQVGILGHDFLDFVPDLPEAWSIRRHLAHLLVYEIDGFIRANPLLTESCKDDQTIIDCFLTERDWLQESVEDCCFALMTGRELVFDFATAADKGVFNQAFQVRLETGETRQLGFAACLEFFIAHARTHLDFIDRNIQAYGESQIEL